MSLLSTRIFFGHQSVGANIIDGVNDLLSNEQIRVIGSRNSTDFEGPCLFHCPIGENHDPFSKIHDFVSLMESGFGNNVDIACFKFCYIDIDESTDIDLLFDTYRSNMEVMTQKFRKTNFLHITVPLRAVEHGIRRIVKEMLGKESIQTLKNIKRQFFNDLMIKQYGRTGALFDLARIESTFLSGLRCRTQHNGNQVYSLVPKYTNDGGHLNILGRKLVAKGFLSAIDNMSNLSIKD